MRNWKRRARRGYADARKQRRHEVMHLWEGDMISTDVSALAGTEEEKTANLLRAKKPVSSSFPLLPSDERK
jgi:hypothetical protein